LAAVAAVQAFLGSGYGAVAQRAETIHLVVPLPAGGAADILARILSEQIGRSSGPQLIVENRAGASSIVGTEAVARAPPDGNTLLLNGPYMLIAPRVRKVSYDPLTSFEPLCKLVSSPGIIAVNGASSYRSLMDLLAAARARPGQLTFGSVGPATAQHLGFEKLRRAAGTDLTYIPYAGGAPAINDLLGGHITAVFAEYAPLASHLQAGTLRALATSSAKRLSLLPELPTVAETGFPGYEVDLWWGLFAPAKTPQPTLAQLSARFSRAIADPEIEPKLTKLGFAVAGVCGADFAAILRRQYDEYGKILGDAAIRTE
jgi:tripartite-type tricarboxylate transporter receptor subunit TctC